MGTDGFLQGQIEAINLMDSRGRQEGIDLALERIASGDYEECEGCEEEIPRRRLQAMPLATRCVDCEAAHEVTHPPTTRPPTGYLTVEVGSDTARVPVY